MSEIDRERVAAVAKLEEMGFRFLGGAWVLGEDATLPPGVLLMAQLVKRRAALEDCADGTPEAAEFNAIDTAVGQFEALWWDEDGRDLPWEEFDEVDD